MSLGAVGKLLANQGPEEFYQAVTYLGDMTVGVAQRNSQLDFVTDFDTMVVQILNALAQPLGEVELLGQCPTFLASILDHILPMFFS